MLRCHLYLEPLYIIGKICALKNLLRTRIFRVYPLSVFVIATYLFLQLVNISNFRVSVAELGQDGSAFVESEEVGEGLSFH